MTEPPRPPGEGNPNDPTAPFNPYAANEPAPGSTPPPPPPGYTPPPSSGAGGYPPPGSGAGGYPPPAGGYPPQPGQPPYDQGQPQYGYAPPPSPQDDKTWILINHFGGAAGAFLGGGCSGWIVPLIVLLARGQQSPVVRAEAVKALNFQILWSIVALVGWATTCLFIGFIIGPVAWIIAIVFGVIAGVKASNNEPYNYPMSVQIIK